MEHNILYWEFNFVTISCQKPYKMILSCCSIRTHETTIGFTYLLFKSLVPASFLMKANLAVTCWSTVTSSIVTQTGLRHHKGWTLYLCFDHQLQNEQELHDSCQTHHAFPATSNTTILRPWKTGIMMRNTRNKKQMKNTTVWMAIPANTTTQHAILTHTHASILAIIKWWSWYSFISLL